MTYSYYKKLDNLKVEDFKDKYTAWTEEGINNHIIYVYDSGDASEAKGWNCATVICKPGLEMVYQYSGWNIFALNKVISKINDNKLLLKKEENIIKDKSEETKSVEEYDFCTWNYASKIVNKYHHEDRHFNIAVDKIMESVSLAVSINCGDIPAIMNILKNINITLGKSKTDIKKTKNIWNHAQDNGNDIYFISEYTLDWSRKTLEGYVYNSNIKSVNVDFNMRILSPKNAKAKKVCEQIMNKCIQGGIIADIVKDFDLIEGFQ